MKYVNEISAFNRWLREESSERNVTTDEQAVKRAEIANTAMTVPIRITPNQRRTLDALAQALEISGQRGATLQPLIHELERIASGALAETAAALEIAAGCAAGEDWDELVEAIRPSRKE